MLSYSWQSQYVSHLLIGVPIFYGDNKKASFLKATNTNNLSLSREIECWLLQLNKTVISDTIQHLLPVFYLNFPRGGIERDVKYSIICSRKYGIKVIFPQKAENEYHLWSNTKINHIMWQFLDKSYSWI